MFLVKLPPTGQLVWSKVYDNGLVSDAPGGRLAWSPTGHLVWGIHSSTSALLRTFAPDGALLWETALQKSSPGALVVRALDVFPDGRVALAGTGPVGIDLGDGPLDSGAVFAVFGP
jgi:hypothetical protein